MMVTDVIGADEISDPSLVRPKRAVRRIGLPISGLPICLQRKRRSFPYEEKYAYLSNHNRPSLISSIIDKKEITKVMVDKGPAVLNALS